MLFIIYTKSLPCFPGNDNLHAITAQKKYTLRVDLVDFEGRTRFAEYANFAVASEDNKYTMTVGSYSGTAGDYDAYFKLYLCSYNKPYHAEGISIVQAK